MLNQTANALSPGGLSLKARNTDELCRSLENRTYKHEVFFYEFYPEWFFIHQRSSRSRDYLPYFEYIRHLNKTKMSCTKDNFFGRKTPRNELS